MAAPPGAGARVPITPSDEIAAIGRVTHSSELPVNVQMRLDLQWTDLATQATVNAFGDWSDAVECPPGVATNVPFRNSVRGWGVGTIAYRWGSRLVNPDGSVSAEKWEAWVGAAFMIYPAEVEQVTIELIDLTIIPH